MAYSIGRWQESGDVCARRVVTAVALVVTSCTYHADQPRTDTGQGDSTAAYASDARFGVDTPGDELTKLDALHGDQGGPELAADLVLDHAMDGATGAETMPSDPLGAETIADLGLGLDAVSRDAVDGAVIGLAADAVPRDGPPASGSDTWASTDLSRDEASKDVIASDINGPDAPAVDATVLGPESPPSCLGASQLCSDGTCHDLQTDNAHCGQCGYPCSNGHVCSNGLCGCATGSHPCGTTCTNTNFDPQNCGACGQSCDGGLLCSGGACGGACINSTLCEDRCVDLNSDRADCGACGHACTFTNADAYCEGGTCHMGACQPGYGNPDGSEANGCECATTNGGVEVCDGVDNNCDGMIDFTIANGLPTATCKCQEQILTVATATSQCGQQPCSNPQCTISNPGQEMELDYALGACTGPNYPWAQCRFDTIYMNAFDADHGDAGVLEIYLCVDGLQAGEKMNGIGVYYGPYPGRKRFAFFTDQELSQGVSNGCYTKHFRPSDAECQAETGLPSTCTSGCPNGKWGSSGHSECVVDYNGVPLWVTAERCQGTAAVSANVQHVQVRYLTGGVCTCLADTDCRDPSRPHCDPASKVCVPL